MLAKRFNRRVFGAILIVAGGALMWSAASPIGGAILFAVAVALEVIGIRLESRNTARSDAVRRDGPRAGQ